MVTEFNIATLLVLLPLIAGALGWYDKEWNRSKCAQETFTFARAQLIRTNSPVHLTRHCGTIEETVDLLPLESLDRGGSFPALDMIKKAIQLLGAALHSPYSPSSLHSYD